MGDGKVVGQPIVPFGPVWCGGRQHGGWTTIQRMPRADGELSGHALTPLGSYLQTTLIVALQAA